MKNEQPKTPKFDLKKNSSLEVLVVSIIVIGLVGFFVILPQVNTYFDSKRKITQSQATLKDLTAKADQLQKIDLATTNGQLKSALIALPDHPDLTAAVNQIEQIVSDNHFALTDLTYVSAPSDGPSGSKAYEFKVDVTGNVDSLKNLITNLRTTPLLAQLTDLDISNDEADASKATTTTSLSFYYLPPVSGTGTTLTQTTLTPAEQTTMSNIETRVSTSSAVSSDTITGPRGKSNPFQ